MIHFPMNLKRQYIYIFSNFYNKSACQVVYEGPEECNPSKILSLQDDGDISEHLQDISFMRLCLFFSITI